MTRPLVIFLYLIFRILVNANTCSDNSCVENTSDSIEDYNALLNFFQRSIKCCPSGNYTYNPLKRVCLKSNSDINPEWKNPQSSNPTPETLTCDKDKVLVDYDIIVVFTSDGEITVTTEENNALPDVTSIDCDSDECGGSNSTRISPLDSRDYDLFMDIPSNRSETVEERVKRIEAVRVRSGNPYSGGEGGDGGSLPFFLPGGKLGIGGETLDSDAFCFDVREETEDTLRLTARVCEKADRWCLEGRTCVRKCCRDGEMMLEMMVEIEGVPRRRRVCHPHHLGFPVIKDLGVRNPLGVYNGDGCGERGRYILKPKSFKHDLWSLQQNGTLLVPEIDTDGPSYFSPADYCLEMVHAPISKMEGIYAYLCFPELNKCGNSVMETVVYGVAMLISCVFLVATLVAYTILPVRNLHGVTLVTHASCLLVAYFCLGVAKFTNYGIRGQMPCKLLGWSILFSFIAAFSWLSVMCFDIWWTFGQGQIRAKQGTRGVTSKSGGALQGNLHKYILYSIYAWMLPLTITVLTVLADSYGKDYLPYVPPRIGHAKCWFEDDGKWAAVIHFLGPSTILLFADVIMFAFTAVRCWRIKGEIQRMQHSDKEESEREGTRKFGRKWWKKTYKADKERFIMNLKLFAAMGINWFLEIVSWWFSRGHCSVGDEILPLAIWYLSDVANCLHGVFIMNLKLFAAMGINWFLEIVSWWFSRGHCSVGDEILPLAIWYLSDVANCLHGVFVFIVFVGKKKTLAQLWKKLKDICRCCSQDAVSEEGQNISQRCNHSYKTSSLQDINLSKDSKTYTFNEDERKIGRLRKWLINHCFHSRRKKNHRQCNRYNFKESTSTTSLSADACRGNISYVP